MKPFPLVTVLRCGVLALALVGAPAVATAQAGGDSYGIVAGGVSDALTGNPIAGARVEVAGANLRVEADDKGQYVLRHVPAGPVILVISAPGYENERTERVIDSTTTTNVETAMFPSPDQIGSARVELLGEAQRRALDQQRAAWNITSVVAADQLGRFPDGNAAEALQRLPGSTVRLTRGEGYDVIIRGAEPRLNSVTLNGDRVPSVHIDRRAPNLDVIPADLLQTVEVAKTSLPSADGDAIGGSVNLLMREIPKRSIWTTSFMGGHDGLTNGFEQVSGSASGGGRVLGGRLGLFVAGSGSATDRGDDYLTATYAASDPSDVRIQKLLIGRQRAGINATASYQVSNNATAFVHGTFSTYERTLEQQVLRFKVPTGLERELLDQRRRRTIGMASAGGQYLMSRGAALDYHGSLGYSSETRPHDLDVVFGRRLNIGAPPVALTSSNFPAAEESAAFNLSAVSVGNTRSADRDLGGAINFSIPIVRDAGGALKTGVKYRTKLKTRDQSAYDGAVDGTTTLSDFARPGPAFFSGVGANIDPTLANTFADNLRLVQNAGGSVLNHRIREDLLAAYVMVELPLSTRLAIIPGVRGEFSTHEYAGLGFDGVATSPLTASGRQVQWLPGVHIRYAANHDTIVRAALTRSMARPDYADLVPYETMGSDRLLRGNPLLKPIVAWNADVAVERYFRSGGFASVGLFAKTLNQYIYSFTTASMVNGTTMTVTQPQNADAATLAGVELTFQQRLRMLPGPLNDLSVYAGYSWTTSQARYPRATGSPAPMLGQTPHGGDVVLSYERGRFSGSVAMSVHRGFLTTIGQKPEDDLHLAPRNQTDLSIAHQVAPRTWIVFDVRNLTNGLSKTFGPSPSRPASIERFGTYTTFGFRMAF
jgi:TonB-dependent receptor